jgi:hypothetical protein
MYIMKYFTLVASYRMSCGLSVHSNFFDSFDLKV